MMDTAPLPRLQPVWRECLVLAGIAAAIIGAGAWLIFHWVLP